MKRILIIINNFGVGGAERLIIDDANELLKRSDVDFKIITLKNEGKDSLAEQLNKNVKWECVHFNDFFDIKSWFLLCRQIKNFDSDILFTHLWFSNTIGRISGKLVGVSEIISFEHNVYDSLKTRKMFFVDWVLQLLSNKIIAVSNAVKKSLVKHKIRENKIKVILNGIDVSRYQNLNITVLDGEQKKDFTFVYIGRLIYQKGVDILLRAFASVKNGKLLVVGDGVERDSLVKLSKELKITDRVKFLGIRKDIPEILSYADCFILPSRYEGLPMVLLEAVASHKIIIISDFESATEVINNGENGLIVIKNNVVQLASSASLILEDGELRDKLRIGVFNISKCISIENHINRVLSL